MTKWDEVGIIFVIKIIDFDLSLSFQRFPEGYRDDQSEFLELKGEVVFQVQKIIPKELMFLFTLLQNLNIPILLIQVFLSLNILKDNEYTMMHRWLVLLMENMRTSL